MKSVTVNINVIAPDKKEAQWLKDLMQNPLYDDETREESEMRKVWFEAMMGYINDFKRPEHPGCGNCFRNQSMYDDDDIPF